ncbi:MAG: NAD(P)-binding protein [Candidatus Latescibacterota bacterium]
MKPMRDQMKRHTGPVNVCIVGAGAGGSVLAKELAEGGLSVVVLEAGPWLDTREDFINDELTMLDGRIDWDDLRIADGEDPIALGRVNTGRAVGGSTVHYTAVTLRLHEEDFELKPVRELQRTGQSPIGTWSRTIIRSSDTWLSPDPEVSPGRRSMDRIRTRSFPGALGTI